MIIDVDTSAFKTPSRLRLALNRALLTRQAHPSNLSAAKSVSRRRSESGERFARARPVSISDGAATVCAGPCWCLFGVYFCKEPARLCENGKT